MNRFQSVQKIALSSKLVFAAVFLGLAGRFALTDERPLKTSREENRSPTLSTKYGDVSIFPVDNPWNQNIANFRVHDRSAVWLESVGLDRPLHPDFGTSWNGEPNGIPFVVVAAEQTKVKVSFEFAEESDAEPYPIPENPPIEGGAKSPSDSDRHVLIVDPQGKKLYELYQVNPKPGGGWKASSGAIFDLTSNRMRPAGWTSADAAGLPIFPGLARHDEIVQLAELRHALRFTVKRTQKAYIHPARHFASRSTDSKLPPMGMRARLKADTDLTKFPKAARVILEGLKKYGMLLADNGGDWYLSGAPSPLWDDADLATLKHIKVRDFEVVDTGPLVKSSSSP